MTPTVQVSCMRKLVREMVLRPFDLVDGPPTVVGSGGELPRAVTMMVLMCEWFETM